MDESTTGVPLLLAGPLPQHMDPGSPLPEAGGDPLHEFKWCAALGCFATAAVAGMGALLWSVLSTR